MRGVVIIFMGGAALLGIVDGVAQSRFLSLRGVQRRAISLLVLRVLAMLAMTQRLFCSFSQRGMQVDFRIHVGDGCALQENAVPFDNTFHLSAPL